MLETTTMDASAKARSPGNRNSQDRRSREAVVGYGSLVIALVAGWIVRDRQLLDPTEGLGYWLGIVGGSLMLLLLLYPTGKKSTLLRRFGLAKHWFRVHMIFGLVGPLLILYHCNFSVAAINSTVALYSMLAVAISGIVGRYFYTRIHRGLYGKRASIEELREEIADATSNSRGLAAIFPNFIAGLHATSAKLMGNEYTRAISLRHSLSWTFRYYIVRLRLRQLIKRDLRQHSGESEALHNNVRNLRRTANKYAAQQVGLMRQVAQLAFYERLFSLWHVFHMPLFVLLIISALVHVLAVHMY